MHDCDSKERRLAPLGLELLDIDAAALAAPGIGARLACALRAHQLLLIRSVDLAPAAFGALAAQLGPLRPVPAGKEQEPGLAGVHRLSNLGPDGRPSGVHPDPYSLYWHSDGSSMAVPPRYTLLYALRVPDEGGDTSYADMYAACAALPAHRRRALLGRRAIHDVDVARVLRHGRALIPEGAGRRASLRRAAALALKVVSGRCPRHPLIRLHEETGRPCLFVGDHAWSATGRPWLDGRRLVQDLNVFATSHPSWIYRHRWRAGDLVLWDNRCLLHRAHPFDVATHARVLLRAVVQGVTVPIAAPA